MIVLPEKLSWLRMLIRVRGTVTPMIWRRWITIVAVSGAITWMHTVLGWFSLTLSALPFTVIGLALSIFLGFRNSTSYDRFWEGRKLWGSLVNTSRSLARRILTVIDSPDPHEAPAVAGLRREMIYLLIAWVYSLRSLLRGDSREDLRPLLSEADFAELAKWSHPPLYLAQRLGESIQVARRKGWVDPLHVGLLEEPLSGLIDIQGGCERILKTPIPIAYIVLLHQLAFAYCLMLPFGLVKDMEIYTPLLVMVTAYAFLGLDAIGDSIENPFEFEPHDLPLSSLCRTIEINLRQQLGETDLPPALKPDAQGLLM